MTLPSKRILLLGSYANSLLNFRGNLIADLKKAGHHVIAAAPDISDEIRQQLMALGAEVAETPLVRTGMNPLSDLRYMRTIGRLMDECKPDLLISYTIKPNIWGAFAARQMGISSAAMVTGLGYAFTGEASGIKRRIVSGLARLLYNQATRANKWVIFQNPDDRNDFINAGCLADDSKCLMMNGSGVDTHYYDESSLPEQPVFLMISRLLGNKGVREYAAAAINTMQEYPNSRFMLVGYLDEGPDGIEEAELDSWINAGLEYLGPQDDVRPALAQCSVYVLPSYREGTPRSVLEAMSAGRAIITSDAPGCRETTVDGDNGFLVPVKDVGELSARMKVLIENPSLRRSMGERSRAIAVSKYDTAIVNEKLMRDLELIQ